MRRIALLSLCLAVGCSLLMVLGYARSITWWRGSHKTSEIIASPAAQAANPIPLGAFVAGDLPVVLSGLTIVKDAPAINGEGRDAAQSEGLPRLRFRVASKGRANVKSLTFAFFDFDERGLLRRVDSWARAVDLTESRGPAEITLDLDRNPPPNHRQVLAIEHARGDSATWRAQFQGLARAANKVSAGLPVPAAIVNQSEKALPDAAGSILCSNGFRKAMLLAQLGDGQSPTSFICDQNNRSFSFTFNGKDLGQ
jgi:hypothetical protein